MDVEATLGKVEPLDFDWHVHVEHPVLPDLVRMDEVVEFGAEYEKIGDVGPQEAVD